MKHFLLMLLPAAMLGCATTQNVPVVKEAQKCAPPPSLLESCAEPASIRQGITFGEILEVSSRDRDALEACTLRHKRLVETIAECNGSIDRYNAEIREINAIKAKQ